MLVFDVVTRCLYEYVLQHVNAQACRAVPSPELAWEHDVVKWALLRVCLLFILAFWNTLAEFIRGWMYPLWKACCYFIR